MFTVIKACYIFCNLQQNIFQFSPYYAQFLQVSCERAINLSAIRSAAVMTLF